MRPSPVSTRVRRLSGAPGFTLIELMVTVAIVAVLAAIALPSYRSYVLRSHRSDALSTLTLYQTILERCYAQNFSYAVASCTALPSLPATTPQGFYSIALSNGSATTYTLTATPQSSQAADLMCASISINQANQKIASDSSSVAQTSCWNP